MHTKKKKEFESAVLVRAHARTPITSPGVFFMFQMCTACLLAGAAPAQSFLWRDVPD